ncbi:uncharacterized protein LOC103830906 [Brassica rapa]|uniref:uncharacterized protein LOC103830906 n=1 Tax=Brassica campestris TaxID=3711 RepID=UPI00087288F6|nr:uncharacterized protein LOC103830906 [Brassica rapa]
MNSHVMKRFLATRHRTKLQAASTQQATQPWNWHKFVWSPKMLPKIKTFIWRCSLNNLPTGENLRRRGLLGNTLCTRCGAEETLEHIFFSCAPAKAVWELCPWTEPMDPLSCTSFRNTLEISFSKVNLPPIGTSANIFAWVCWSLWINRNQFTFENKSTAPRDILSKAIALLKEWEFAQPPPAQSPNIPPPLIPTQISSSATIICCSDAAWKKDSGEAGLAWIFKKHTGEEISRGCRHDYHVSSALMAEALAVRAALEHAFSLNLNIIWLRSDCKRLIQAINSTQGSVELYGVLADIESIIASSPSFSFHASFIPRALNGPADLLAKSSLCNKLSVLGSGPH